MEFIFDGRPSDSPFVEKIWHTTSDQAGLFMSKASTHWEIVVWKEEGLAGITVRGPGTIANLAESPGGAEFFGIVFKMGVFMPHLPIGDLVDGDLMLPEATGHSFWFNSSVWQLPTYENADTFLDRLTRDGLLMRDPVVTAALQGEEPDVSLRTLQYRFLRATGLTQKTIQQIDRAQQAETLLGQGSAIQDVIYDLGYFDQAHLTRSMKRFVGQTPAQVAGKK